MNSTLYKVSEIFDIIGEENITNEYINANKGNYPVYSGQTKDDGLFGFINNYKYDEEMLTYTTYGSAGKVFLRSGKYTIGRNNCGLRLKKEFIGKVELHLCRILLENEFSKHKKTSGNFGILPQSIVRSIEINIPISLESQRKLIQKLLFYKILKVKYRNINKNLKV